MKNYKEVAEDVLHRRDEYVVNRLIRIRRVKRIAVLGCCILVLFGIIGTRTDLLHPASPVAVDHEAVKENELHIHQIGELASDKVKIAYEADDFIKMNRNEVSAYYGLPPFPEDVLDLHNWDNFNDYRYGIYQQNSGEIYFDQNAINYSNDEVSRSVNIEVAKGKLPIQDVVIYGKKQFPPSMINNIEVGIGRTPYGDYYAEFMYKEVGFKIISNGLTQDEFISVLELFIL